MPIKHYRPHRCKPVCVGTHWPDALTEQAWRTLWHRTNATTTNVYKVTCTACIKQVSLDLSRRLGR